MVSRVPRGPPLKCRPNVIILRLRVANQHSYRDRGGAQSPEMSPSRNNLRHPSQQHADAGRNAVRGPFQSYVALLGTLKVFLQKDLKNTKINSVIAEPQTTNHITDIKSTSANSNYRPPAH